MRGKLDISWVGTKHLLASLASCYAWRRIDSERNQPAVRPGRRRPCRQMKHLLHLLHPNPYITNLVQRIVAHVLFYLKVIYAFSGKFDVALKSYLVTI